MEIRPVGAEMFHADGRTDRDRHDEVNSHFSQFCERAKKWRTSTKYVCYDKRQGSALVQSKVIK
jgi:hypothetical protein